MKPSTIVGVLLILAGCIGFAMGGFSFKHEKKDVDLGPIQIQHQQTRHVYMPPVLNGLLVGVGLGLLVFGSQKK